MERGSPSLLWHTQKQLFTDGEPNMLCGRIESVFGLIVNLCNKRRFMN